MPSSRVSITLPERYRKLLQSLASKNGNPSEAAEASRIVMDALDALVDKGTIPDIEDEDQLAIASYQRIVRAAVNGEGVEPGDLEIIADHADISVQELKALLKLENGHATTPAK